MPHVRVGIRVRFFITYILIVAVVLTVLNTYPIIISRDSIFESKYRTLEAETRLITTSVQTLDVLSKKNIELVMDILDSDELDGVYIVDAEKNTMYEKSSHSDDEAVCRKYIDVALNKKDAFFSSFGGGEFVSVYAMPVVYDGAVNGAVCILNKDSSPAGVIAALRNNLMGITVVLSLISIAISILFTQSMTKSIRRVLEGIRNVREGEYTYKVKTVGNDELALIGEEFNSLTDRLRKTEEIRKQFVSDASHELKTPLASIQLLSDSIVQNEITDSKIIREFAGDIGDEARRLARTTEKLLRLTNLDNKSYIERERVELAPVARRVVKMLRPIAERGDITINESFEDCAVFASGDDIYEIMTNLIENAVKYNVRGGRVDAAIYKEGGSAVFTVSDTGVGIPEEQIDLVFDRFYRVDKARSRERGGSGLGLSIVKSTVMQYGGELTAKRGSECGMVFTVKLPLFDENGTDDSIES